MFSVAAWSPGGATISRPCGGSSRAPRRTGPGALHHPAPSQRVFHQGGGICTQSFAKPIDSDRLPPIPTIKARVQALGLGTRPVVNRASPMVTDINPLCAGPCRPRAMSPAGTPSLGPRYRDSSLLWVPPTSRYHRPLPRLFGPAAHRYPGGIPTRSNARPCQAPADPGSAHAAYAREELDDTGVRIKIHDEQEQANRDLMAGRLDVIMADQIATPDPDRRTDPAAEIGTAGVDDRRHGSAQGGQHRP